MPPVNDRQAGRPLVLLPAGGHGPAMWRPQREALGERFDLLTPDLGDARRGTTFRIRTAADEVAALIAGRPPGRAAVCGISLGAMVALDVAARYPERVDALVLAGGQVRPSRALLTLNYVLLGLLPARIVLPAGGSKRAFLAGYRDLFTLDARPLLAQVRARTLVVCGGRDRANLPAARQLAAGIPTATLAVVPGAGHLLNLSHAEIFDRLLTEFLSATAAS